ncbi:telomere-capping, CST complex subunit-domain-containing protein [Pilobolus umbonatus]|nr:telomere-capping, CST complex subunit-domain-containing protein [Pilobolus umbonatus]
MASISPGRLTLLCDLHKNVVGDSVRVTGILKKHDMANDLIVIDYDGSQAEISIKNIYDFVYINGDLIQCIGEVTEKAVMGMPKIEARILRTVNTLDMDLYYRVVTYLNEKIR